MKNKLVDIKNRIFGQGYSEMDYADKDEEYLELDAVDKKTKSKVLVKPFLIKEFEDIKPVLDALREGYTISLINIKPMKDKDIVELKRTINKLKKTCDAIDGDIAGFGEDWIVATPSFAQVHRTYQTDEVKEEREE